MIFVCTGSRDYQFDRLLKALDQLVEEKIITERIVAQTGGSLYVPKQYEHHPFLSADQFKACQLESSLIISHAGTGALIGALKLGKQVISVPRLSRYGEHIDDHQLQISGILAKEGYLREVIDMSDFPAVLQQCRENPIVKKYDKPSHILGMLVEFIEKNG